MSYFEFLKSFSLPFYIILIITVLSFGWGAFTLLTAKRDSLKIAKGNKILFYTIIGFIVVTVCFLIFTFGENLIKNKTVSDNKNPSNVYEAEFPPAPYSEPLPPLGVVN